MKFKSDSLFRLYLLVSLPNIADSMQTIEVSVRPDPENGIHINSIDSIGLPFPSAVIL
jgi:hypothetical protein